jgi:hypothetical protein
MTHRILLPITYLPSTVYFTSTWRDGLRLCPNARTHLKATKTTLTMLVCICVSMFVRHVCSVLCLWPISKWRWFRTECFSFGSGGWAIFKRQQRRLRWPYTPRYVYVSVCSSITYVVSCAYALFSCVGTHTRTHTHTHVDTLPDTNVFELAKQDTDWDIHMKCSVKKTAKEKKELSKQVIHIHTQNTRQILLTNPDKTRIASNSWNMFITLSHILRALHDMSHIEAVHSVHITCHILLAIHDTSNIASKCWQNECLMFLENFENVCTNKYAYVKHC